MRKFELSSQGFVTIVIGAQVCVCVNVEEWLLD